MGLQRVVVVCKNKVDALRLGKETNKLKYEQKHDFDIKCL